MVLYSYWRSTTAYRVRIAMALKGLAYETRPINLVAGGQNDPDYIALNPIAGVPTLVLPDGAALTQSMAILDYLDATHPTPALVPADPLAAARVRAAALVVACDIHPVNNLKVGQKLRDMGHDQADVVAWMCDWMARGFAAFQALLPDGPGPYAFGAEVTLADICLVPQLYNAHRWGLDLAPFERLTQIETACRALPAFATSAPEAQPDAAP